MREPEDPKRTAYIGLGVLIGLGTSIGLVAGVLAGNIGLGLTFGVGLQRLVSRSADHRRTLTCFLKPLRDPDLDSRLPRHPETAGFAV